MKITKYRKTTTKYKIGYYSTVYVLALSFISIIALIGLKTNIPINKFTRDIAAIAEINPFFGVISNVGILLWCASASICLFSFAVLQNFNNKSAASEKRKLQFFLLFSGLITSMIMFDDLFMLHEEIFPSLNVSEKAVYCSYMAIILFYVLKFRKTILKTEWAILGLGFLCFGASIAIDVLPISSNRITFFEDGLKLFGIANWFAYFGRLCFQILKNATELDINYYIKRKPSKMITGSSKSISYYE